jgi:tyrosyl-tRNA synthetase
VLPDWSAVARDEVTGEEKYVTAALQFNTELLKTFGLSPKVTTVAQGQTILRNSDAYWVTAINVGRKLSLADIEPALNGEITNAGSVIGCLMRVADAVTLGASHVFSTPSDMNQAALAAQFTRGAIASIPFPATELVPAVCDPKTPPMTPDDVLFADDNDMDLKRKIKKAYCAPGEVENSIVAIASWSIQTVGPLTVTRPDGNGGPVTYSSAEMLAADFASQSLHPGDLKASVTNVLLEVTKAARAFVASADGKKLSQSLRQAEKNALKKK